VVEETEPEAESDLRRRAAWLLGMLAIVAILVVVVLTQVLGTDTPDNNGQGPAPLDSAIGTATRTPSPHTSTPAHAARSRSSAARSSSPRASGTKCPTPQTCVLDGDVGNGVAAINAYRTQHGRSAVPGKVSEQAQTCAVHNGNGCSGGWAETEVAKPNGTQAVQKILQFGRLLDPQLKDFEVGWAYDPGAKLYYFALIRND
jgi:hypothetical protein